MVLDVLRVGLCVSSNHLYIFSSTTLRNFLDEEKITSTKLKAANRTYILCTSTRVEVVPGLVPQTHMWGHAMQSE